jgi:hypothetical protein
MPKSNDLPLYRVVARYWDRGARRDNPTYVIERRLSDTWGDLVRCVENARGGIRKFWCEENAQRAMRKLVV